MKQVEQALKEGKAVVLMNGFHVLQTQDIEAVRRYLRQVAEPVGYVITETMGMGVLKGD